MKRLERLGSVAFGTILLSNVFHLLGMSYKSWISIDCKTCNITSPFKEISISIRERCYEASMGRIFDDGNMTINYGAFRTSLCMPNQFPHVKERRFANYCYETVRNNPDIACVLQTYNPDSCACDYTTRTKVALATTVIASVALGVMIFLGHLISFVKIDYILNWLIPLCFGLIITAIVCITIAISVIGALLQEDIWELMYQWSLYEARTTDLEAIEVYRIRVAADIDKTYTARIGWSAGLEIMALYFSLISLVLYALMFIAKRRPEAKPRKERQQQTELSETNRKT